MCDLNKINRLRELSNATELRLGVLDAGFNMFSNSECACDSEFGKQIWYFDTDCELKLGCFNFSEVFVVVDANATVVLNLRIRSLEDLESFSLESIVASDASLVLNVLIEDSVNSSKVFIGSHLVGHNSSSNLNIVYDLVESSRLEMECELRFVEARNSGKMMINGVLDGKSFSCVDSKIYISDKASLTDSEMQQELLLLSDDCRNEVTPALDIYTNDVKAAHGVSISRVPEEVLFYFASRGVDFDSAKKLYKEALKNKLF